MTYLMSPKPSNRWKWVTGEISYGKMLCLKFLDGEGTILQQHGYTDQDMEKIKFVEEQPPIYDVIHIEDICELYVKHMLKLHGAYKHI